MADDAVVLDRADDGEVLAPVCRLRFGHSNTCRRARSSPSSRRCSRIRRGRRGRSGLPSRLRDFAPSRLRDFAEERFTLLLDVGSLLLGWREGLFSRESRAPERPAHAGDGQLRSVASEPLIAELGDRSVGFSATSSTRSGKCSSEIRGGVPTAGRIRAEISAFAFTSHQPRNGGLADSKSSATCAYVRSPFAYRATIRRQRSKESGVTAPVDQTRAIHASGNRCRCGSRARVSAGIVGT